MNRIENDYSFSRRQWLTAAAATGLAAWLARPVHGWAAQSAAGLPYLNRLGLQLYTVRDQMAEDPRATLRAIAAAGYKQVELMSIDEEALQLAAMAREEGLRVHSGFLNWRCIASPENNSGLNVEQSIEMAERIGLRHVVFGYIDKGSRDTADKIKAIADRSNQAAAKTRDAGMRMAYHNHSFEFGDLDGGKTNAYDIFIERFDPQLMDFELDVFWVKIGGHDPIALMKKLAGRITMVHLKDLKDGTATIHDEGNVPKDAFQECGDGTIDIPAVMQLAKEIGVLECHVEQDQSPAPLESIAESYRFLANASVVD
ncbi:sugar phosphate isomerase/epimerase family protein [Roseiconus lacunae]|uniref:Sugar phosphate isomerase/epimerase family protein n=1 Tax=Roseiconus lacunae TaxID=2605694 RepID=A0ABT7PD39_9BACT|nr:sugar phosphate isomerase/epimerase family protein [Roseiconus lacunae]MCD0462408.1 sugar phosphate isomerase/epimerase [Roseiconus lacunae]MDM4014161.1 sugar phosphate isomerase/epimerase family protein [Roseiconus lacunae]WRQ53457.1 sugar phosphate isomerase/epimerase family protein [Stieleria sp. HD01]